MLVRSMVGTGMLMPAFVFRTLVVRRPGLDACVYANAKAGCRPRVCRRRHGAAVVELPGARDWPLDRKIIVGEVGIGLAASPSTRCAGPAPARHEETLSM